MADQKVTDMTELTAPTIDDALYVVDDADGTPLSRRITLASLFKMQGSDGLADDTYYGFTISGIAAGETLTQWDLVYLDDTENEWMKADADAAGTGTGAITEAGIFDSATQDAGNMWVYSSFDVINKAAGDSLVVTWTLTFGS